MKAKREPSQMLLTLILTTFFYLGRQYGHKIHSRRTSSQKVTAKEEEREQLLNIQKTMKKMALICPYLSIINRIEDLLCTMLIIMNHTVVYT